MAVPKVPEYKPWVIEDIAQRFLDKHWEPAEVVVDIEQIVERELDVLIDITRAESFRVLGSICRRVSDDRLVIVVSEHTIDQSPKVYRFTLAQEVGHLLLHRRIIDALWTPDDVLAFQNSVTPQQYRYLESDVNRCAGAILMPQRQFRDAAHASYARWCKRVGQAGQRIETSGKFLQKAVVADLAKLYDVNPKPAEIRLRNSPIKLYARILTSASKGLTYIDEG
jgi:hypothetical protein